MRPSYKGTDRNATAAAYDFPPSGLRAARDTVLAILRGDIFIDHGADHIDHSAARPRLGGGRGRHVERTERQSRLPRTALQRVGRYPPIEETSGDGLRRA